MESKELKKILNKTRRTENIELSVDQVKEIIKDLEMLEELKYPYDEYENEKYLCRREAYYNENLGELCFGYTIYEWNGEYKERYIPVLKKAIKEKLWKEVLHAGTSSEKKEFNEQYIQDYIKLKEMLKGKKDGI